MARVGVTAVIALLGLCVDARAQERESGEGPVKSAPVGEWSANLRLQQAWDSNVRFVTEEAEAALVSRLAVGLGHLWRGERGQIQLSADGEGSFYQGSSDLNRLNYGARLSGTQRLSSKLETSLLTSHASTYGRDVPVLVDAGLLLPTTVTRTSAAGLGLTYRASSQSTVVARADYSRVDFRESDLQDGSSLTAGLTWNRALGQRDTVTLSQLYQDSASADRNGRTHTITAGWQRQLGRRARLGGSFGLSRMSSEEGTAKLRPQGTASLSVRLRQSAVSLQYSRTVSQAFGFGRDRLADQLSANYEIEATRSLRLLASYALSVSRDPFDPGFRLNATAAAASWAWDVTRGLSLEGGYTLRRNTGSFPTAASHAASVSLSYRRGGEDRSKPDESEAEREGR